MRLIYCLAVSLAVVASAHARPPQAPLAKGGLEAIFEVIRAAHACGMKSLRIETEGNVTRLYWNGGKRSEAMSDCYADWKAANGKRVGLIDDGYY